jgi:hypothetical protein
MTQCARVRALLSESPSTVQEVEALTGWSGRKAHLALWMLSSTGQIEPCGFVSNPDTHARGRGRRLNLWRLTRAGERFRTWDVRKIQDRREDF